MRWLTQCFVLNNRLYFTNLHEILPYLTQYIAIISANYYVK